MRISFNGFLCGVIVINLHGFIRVDYRDIEYNVIR